MTELEQTEKMGAREVLDLFVRRVEDPEASFERLTIEAVSPREYQARIYYTTDDDYDGYHLVAGG